VPFEQALRETCAVALDQGSHWTIVVDADLLVSPKRIRRFVDFAQRAPESVFQIQGFILDKLTGTVRVGGPRLYRTRLLSEALKHIPADGDCDRPESRGLIKGMERAGYRCAVAPLIIASHDYEQYYRDIYRKCYVHSRKHMKWLGQFAAYWRDHRDQDADFRIAMHGMWHGLDSDESLRLDIRTLPTEIEDVLQQEGLKEKTALPSGAISAEDVERTLAESPAVIEWERRRSATIWQRLGRKCDEIGWWRIAPWGVGKGLQRIGLNVEQMVTKRTPE